MSIYTDLGDRSEGKNLVFGSTGAYGYAIVRELEKQGKEVLAVCRDLEKGRRMFSKSTETIQVDIMSEEQVLRACQGASVVYAGHNFPYSDWKLNYVRSMENIMKGCAKNHSLLVFPGNVYGYGRFKYLPVDENHPHDAISRKGIIRNKIESELMEGHKRGKFNLIIPRFADFYGPNVTNDLYGAMFRNAINGKTSIWPGNADMDHQFTFIGDAARATMELVDNATSHGQVFHVCGKTISAREFISKIYLNVGSKPRVRVVPKSLIAISGILNSQAMELLELMYEYTEPYVIDDSKFKGLFPSFNYTDYDDGIRQTLQWYRMNKSW